MIRHHTNPNERKMNKLQGKVAIITGGASGIGEETARLFADHGAKMVVIADIQDDLAQNVAASIGPNKCTYKRCDVTSEDQVKSLVDYTVNTFGHLDVMFSNAGVITTTCPQSVIDLDLAAMDATFAVNVKGNAACVKHAARVMVAVAGGSIVCTASVAGSIGGRRMTDYFMSKHAVVGLVRSASLQLGEHGIMVNCVSPYVVSTPMARRGLHGGSEMTAESVESSFAANMCLKGAALRARNVADAVLFLACGDSDLITGLDLVVDGGYSGRH
ncbi:(+)-cis,trans-nepetalactol synthase NEPS1 [Linum perenne]